MAVSTATIVLIVLGGLGLTIAVLWLVRRWFFAMIATARRRLEALAAGRVAKRLDDRANFFGLESGAAMQVRGNGVLGLYDTELIFVQLMIDRVIRIPLGSITEITTVKGFRGKTILRELLKVTWHEAGGGTETAAWFVVDLRGWLDALGRARPTAVAPDVRG